MSDAPVDNVSVRSNDAPTVILRSGSAGTESERFSPGFILGGRYRIVSLLGRGGMGEVYRADDLKLGQAVALKFLPETLRFDDVERARLYREARAGREVTHPNVCRLFDVVETDHHIFLSMELVDGEDLASLLPRIGRLSPDKALAVARDICAGVAAAHEKGVIHADLKPGNIMIDGRGRARISDFGLASLTHDESERGVIAGTPRYMAPEQFAGVPASVQSDVYALGLVLAEVFTGEPVLTALSIDEVKQQHATAQDISIRSVVPGLDPRIEDAIRACLRRDPAARPLSADEVLKRLPPRDPLAAAVAAGETPSPVMVMDAGQSGELSRRTAYSAFLVALAGVVAVMAAAGRSMLYERQLVQPPEVLETRARGILGRVAPGLRIGDTAAWISVDGQSGEFVIEGMSTEPLPAREGRLLYHFRSGADALVAKNVEFRVLDNDPPFDRSGMARVVLDQGGRLMELAVVPPQLEEGEPSPPDWMVLVRETGILPTRLKAAEPQWTAPFDTDVKVAWTATDARGQAVRIEAAAYHGRPVWLSVITPSMQPQRMAHRKSSLPNRIAMVINVFFLIAIPIAVIILAMRNVRRGHGDLRGATKLALFVGFTSYLTSWLRADHSTSWFDEWMSMSLMAVHASFWGAALWGAYVAVEPLVRKRWPRMMIGWTRLLAGRWRDPMIGQEALAGACAALAILLAWHASVILPEWLGQNVVPQFVAVSPLGSVRQVAYYVSRAFGEACLRAVGAAALLLVLHVVARQRILAATLTIVVLTLTFLGDTTAPGAYRLTYALFAAVIVLYVMTRFGALSLAVTAFLIIVMRTLPVTPYLTKWYFGRGFIAVGAVLAVAIFGLIVAVGKKGILPSEWLEES